MIYEKGLRRNIRSRGSIIFMAENCYIIPSHIRRGNSMPRSHDIEVLMCAQ